jgi:hypothetical protein
MIIWRRTESKSSTQPRACARRTATVFLFIFSSCWATGISTAQGVKIVGLGSADCATFLREIAETKAEERTYFAWAQGYMNGLLIRAPAGVDESLDLSPPAFPIRKQADFIQAFCRANPAADYIDAVNTLYRTLRAPPG